VLSAVGLLVTAGVYGLVVIIVKADDFGVYLAQGRATTTRAIGKAAVHGMPAFLRMLSFVGTVAMLWVGGGILIHGLHSYGIDGPEHIIHVIRDAARAGIPSVDGLLAWLAGAITSATLGLFIGAIAAFAVVPVLAPLWRAVRPVR
jgi:predicted DNA repair protein MutK